jgi:alginate O-acetyltransferase complex protein AlgI
MIFTDLKFAFFFIIVFAVHWLLRRDNYRKYWLLAASYLFYAAWDARFLSLIVMSTAVDFVAASQMQSTRDPRIRKRWLILSLFVNLGMLAVFKYCNFFVDTAIDLADQFGWTGTQRSFELILPVGISFFTFQTLSYTIDVYRRQLEPINDPVDFALFVAFFPQLVAGPIVRARDFLPQLTQRRVWGDVNLKVALTMFLLGYIKKACISDNLSGLIDPVFANPSSFEWLALFGATLGYAVQIYCDFSGYSDMAIATAALLGYTLSENFRFPYFAIGMQDFWRRWHISLSTWLRDYLYIPLGGNQGTRLRRTISLLITMTLGGLWHGAAWSFLLWGAIHGIALVVAHNRPAVFSPRRPIGLFAAGLATFVFVSLLWIVFRVPELDKAWLMIWSLLTGNSPGNARMGSYLWTFLAIFAISHTFANRHAPSSLVEKLPDPVFWLVLGAGTALALSFANQNVTPFIYFQF